MYKLLTEAIPGINASEDSGGEVVLLFGRYATIQRLDIGPD